MDALTKQLAAALRAVMEQADNEAFGESPVDTERLSAAHEALGAFDEAVCARPKPRMHYHPRGFWVPRYERGVSRVLGIDDVIHFNRINGRLP